MADTEPDPTEDAATAPTFLRLDADQVVRTVAELRQRIGRRFPGSGLFDLSRQLLNVATQARERSLWIAKPILPLRIGIGLLVLLIAAGIAGTVYRVGMPREPLGFFSFVQVLESGINDVVLVTAGVFFLATLETRIKRTRARNALNELRAIAHIIDMHQLTKDPEWVMARGEQGVSHPRRQLTPFELSRYLDYCSEMLSLTGKCAVLCVQGFDDDVALRGVNEIEDLTTGLSRKIWQKLMILYALEGEAGGRGLRRPEDDEAATRA
jgi:hypothetical protein